MDIEKRLDQLFPQLVEIRRDFHMYPELSEKEYRTSEKISQYLTSWDIEHQKAVAETGLVAIIRGKKDGITVGARADIDALPIVEENDLEYKSKNHGVMHACGHDVHTAIHLGVAKLLKEMEDQISGNIKIFFQPAEETVGGAKRMIEEGHLKDPKVEYMTALHVMPYMDAGHIEYKYGRLNASRNEFSIKIEGRSSHGAYPDKSIDAIVAAGYIITSLQSFVSRNTSPLESLVLSFGKIEGGCKNNIIADQVTLSGTLRTLDKNTRIKAKKRIQEIVEHTASAHRARASIEFCQGYPELINHNRAVDILRETAEEILGKDRVHLKKKSSMGADDFAFFCQETKGVYYNLGSGNKAKGWTYPIHSEKFMVDEESIKTGVLLQTKTLLRMLDEGKA